MLKIDPDSAMPIYAQIVEEVQRAVATGYLRPGDQLPTVRQLAVDLKVNPNTVARAYMELERAGVIATRRGRGTFVVDSGPLWEGKRDLSLLADVARRALLEAYALGFSARELIDVLEAQMAAVPESEDSGGR